MDQIPIFTNDKGEPYRLFIHKCPEKERITNLIEHGFGTVENCPVGENTVVLAPPGFHAGKNEIFSVEYIIACCSRNKKLNIKDFRLNKISMYNADFNPMDVLEGILTWSQAEIYRNVSVLAVQASFLIDHEDDSDGADDIQLDSSFHLRRQRRYSRAEQKDIVKCVVRHGAYGLLRGTAFWKMMEEKMVCNKRTWQSMKEQFFKKILPDIESFNLSESQISRFKNLKSNNARRYWENQNLKNSVFEESTNQPNRRTDSPSKDNHKQGSLYIEHQDSENEQCFLRNANYYTEAEDKALLDFVVQQKRYGKTGGVQLWKLMERKQAVPGRSWQSMKERYRKVLSRKLDQYLPSDVVNQIMKAEIRGTKWKIRTWKPSAAVGILSPQSREIYKIQTAELASDISKAHPDCLVSDCTRCFGSNTNTSFNCTKSTVSVVSSTPNKREPPKNHVHIPKRKLFSQRKSLVDFTPGSEGERRIQSSNLQLRQITEVNRKRDAKGCNRVMKDDAVSCAQKKSQHSKDIASYDVRKSDVAVCNTECASQDTGAHQENVAGTSGGSFTKENTVKASSALVSEGNLLTLRGASDNSMLNNSALHLNTEANRNCQELQVRLTRDSLVCSPRSSGSEYYLNIVSGDGTESELNVSAFPDSAQETLNDDKVNEKQIKRNYLSHGERTVLSKEGKINAKSIRGENEGEMLNYPIHESLLDKWEEVQWISSRDVLEGCSVVEQLSCGNSHDREISEKSSSELNLGESSDKQSLLKNYHCNHKVTVYPKTQFSDKNALTKSLSPISWFDGSESGNNSLNGEDIAPGRNGHNILKLKHSIAGPQNGDGKLSEKVGSEREKINEECIEKHININLMQLCKENKSDCGRVSRDGNNVPMPDIYKIYGKNVAHLNFSSSIKDILNDSICMLKDNQLEILEIPEFVPLRADGNQQVSGTGDAEHITKETSGARILSPNSGTSDETYHDVVLARPDPTVSNPRVLYLAAEKKIPSVRQNGRTVCTQLVEKEAVGFLPTHSGKKSGESETQPTVQNGLGMGQITKTRDSSKSSLTSGRNNPNRKFSLSMQATENDDKCLSQADSRSWKSGMNTIIKKCKQNEDCINSTHAKEKILNDLLSQREEATIESCHAVNTLGQTNISDTVLYFSSHNSSVVSCDQVPENITANTGQHSSEESSFCCSSQELVSPSSSLLLPPEESSCSQKKGFAAQSMVTAAECEEARNLEHSVTLLEHQENSTELFGSCADNSDSPVQQSVDSPGHNLHVTANTASRNDSSAGFGHFDVYNKPTKKRWEKNSDCSICDRTQNMEPFMPDI